MLDPKDFWRYHLPFPIVPEYCLISIGVKSWLIMHYSNALLLCINNTWTYLWWQFHPIWPIFRGLLPDCCHITFVVIKKCAVLIVMNIKSKVVKPLSSTLKLLFTHLQTYEIWLCTHFHARMHKHQVEVLYHVILQLGCRRFCLTEMTTVHYIKRIFAIKRMHLYKPLLTSTV